MTTEQKLSPLTENWRSSLWGCSYIT